MPIPLAEFHAQIEPGARQEPEESWQRGLTTTGLVGGQRRLRDPEQLGEARLGQPESSPR